MHKRAKRLLILSLGLLLLPTQLKPVTVPPRDVIAKKAAIYGPAAVMAYAYYCYQSRKPEKDFKPQYSFSADDVSSLGNFMDYLLRIGTPKAFISEMWYLFHDGIAGFGKQSASFKFDPESKTLIAEKEKIDGHGLVYNIHCRIKPLCKVLNIVKDSKELIAGFLLCAYILDQIEKGSLGNDTIETIAGKDSEGLLHKISWIGPTGK